MEPSTKLSGFYGKLPMLGDFVSRRLSRPFIEPWDAWVQAGMTASREQLGGNWLDAYLRGPLWRFGLSPGLCGPEAWAGVLMPSCDRVGRYFPLTLAAPVPGSTQLGDLFELGGRWFEDLEDLALSGLEADCNLEVFDLRLRALPPPEFATGREAADSSRSARLACGVALEPDVGIRAALASVAGLLLQRFLPAYSLWATAGSQRVPPACLAAEGLPSANAFAALLTGDWRSHGWEMARRPRSDSALPGQNEPAEVPGKAAVETRAAPAADWLWHSYGISVTGNRREINQDALIELGDIGLWAVADGMGGHSAGEVASLAIVSALAALEPGHGLDSLVDRVGGCLQVVNQQLHHLAQASESGDIVGSTVVALMAEGHECAVLWAGDSRLYLWREGQLRQLTRDHSMAQAGIAGARTDMLVRAVGADADLQLDLLRFRAESNDILILCSDGLYKELAPPEIGGLLVPRSCEDSAKALIEAALGRSGRDNITAVVVSPERLDEGRMLRSAGSQLAPS